MTLGIYIASAEQLSGKSVIVLGVMEMIAACGGGGRLEQECNIIVCAGSDYTSEPRTDS